MPTDSDLTCVKKSDDFAYPYIASLRKELSISLSNLSKPIKTRAGVSEYLNVCHEGANKLGGDIYLTQFSFTQRLASE